MTHAQIFDMVMKCLVALFLLIGITFLLKKLGFFKVKYERRIVRHGDLDDAVSYLYNEIKELRANSIEKERHDGNTYIKVFVVILVFRDHEKRGDKIVLSPGGAYYQQGGPNQYNLASLLHHHNRYHPYEIVVQGETLLMNQLPEELKD